MFFKGIAEIKIPWHDQERDLGNNTLAQVWFHCANWSLFCNELAKTQRYLCFHEKHKEKNPTQLLCRLKVNSLICRVYICVFTVPLCSSQAHVSIETVAGYSSMFCVWRYGSAALTLALSHHSWHAWQGWQSDSFLRDSTFFSHQWKPFLPQPTVVAMI